MTNQAPIKPVLTRENHGELMELVLWAGQLMLQHGAEAELVEETIHRLGTALGCDWLDIFISTNSIVVSSTSQGEFRTRTRRIPERPVNMTTVSCIVRLTRRVQNGEHTLEETRAELERIVSIGHYYPRWQIVICIGLACASFCHMFGGQWSDMAIAFVAASAAMFNRQELARRHVNLYLNVMTTAFIATLITSLASRWGLGEQPQHARAAAVLLLIPGVPFLNSIQDIIKGYTVTGISRWTVGTLITFSIALGMILALGITGVEL